MKYIIDIENNNLLASSLTYKEFPYVLNEEAKLWVVVIKNIDTGEIIIGEKEDITKEWLQSKLHDCTEIIGHNIIKFDLPFLKLFGLLAYTVGELNEFSTLFGKPVIISDTLLYSRIFNPDRFGGHSLDAWGKRVGEHKINFRQICIDKGYISAKSEKGSEFKQYCPEMVTYCVGDVNTNHKTYDALMIEKSYNKNIDQAYKQEVKLADRALNRETLGFWFDKPYALECVTDLNQKIQDISDYIMPLLPDKPMNIGELKYWTLPKNQLNKISQPTANMLKFIEKIKTEQKADIYLIDDILYYKGKQIKLPHTKPLESHVKPDIKNYDHIKMELIKMNWDPSEWKQRNLVIDSKKQKMPYDKRIKALEKWYKETMAGKYKEHRLDLIGIDECLIISTLSKRLREDKPVNVPISPPIKVGLEKELCPNLVKLGDKVAFAKDYADYLTYNHRRNCIIGGYDDEVDYEDQEPNSGYLSGYRDEDQRVGTPAIEISCSTHRYGHRVISNVARVTSLYGKELRSLFGCGEGAYQLGADYASLENRILGHYVYNYEGGHILAEQMMAEKPNDFHCFSEDTQILTNKGWKLFGEIDYTTLVAQFDDITKKSNWVNPTNIVWEKYKGDMIHFAHNNTDQLLTPNHRTYSITSKHKKSKIILAKDLLLKSYMDRDIPCGSLIEEGNTEDIDFLKLVLITQADGCLAKDCSGISFSFTKIEKVKRLKTILNSIKATYTEGEYFRKERTEYAIRINSTPLTVKIRGWLTKDKKLTYKFLELNSLLRKQLINEVVNWDGTQGDSGVILDITCEQTVDVFQSICTSLEIKSTKTEFLKKTNFGNCYMYRLYISQKVPHCSCRFPRKRKIVQYDGMIGCVSVPTGLIIVRRNGKVFISGNSLQALKLDMSRGDVKSLNYGLLYGAQIAKVMKMLNCSKDRATELFNDFWESAIALTQLKKDVENEWERSGKKYITAIDGRKILIRSKHSILNALFQSAGVIFAKYVTIFLFEDLQKQGYITSPFEGKPDVCSMIEYH